MTAMGENGEENAPGPYVDGCDDPW
jgi:hypothetical protein